MSDFQFVFAMAALFNEFLKNLIEMMAIQRTVDTLYFNQKKMVELLCHISDQVNEIDCDDDDGEWWKDDNNTTPRNN